jgi:3',5'-cyclic-AMP phosphodiesterase
VRRGKPREFDWATRTSYHCTRPDSQAACKNGGMWDRRPISCGLLLACLVSVQGAAAPESFRFAILGDRTGEARPGVYEQVCKEAAAGQPAFVVSVGDTIQGMDGRIAEAEWREAAQILQVFRGIPVYLASGNHDIWSPASESLFRQYAGHPPHYSFDYGTAHFTVLDNSRSEDLPPEELTFLEADLKAHAAAPLKMIVMHRPSWIVRVALRDPDFALHQLARRYGVQYVIAGHLHQMLRLELEGVQYVSMASAGGHLRASGRYEDGWFFGHAVVEVRGKTIEFRMREAGPPYGEGRVTELTGWGMAGRTEKEIGHR